MRFLSNDTNLHDVLSIDKEFSALRVLDLSAGAGLVTLACAAAGAFVVSCDLPSQLPQLELNVHESGADVQMVPYFWGQPVDALIAAAQIPTCDPPFDLVLASDIVFIAIRDGLTGQLAKSIVELASRARSVLLVFEERLPDEEQDFLEALGFVPPPTVGRRRRGVDEPAIAAAAAGPPLLVREVTGPAVVLSAEEALSGAGGHPDTDLWSPSLFWEPPPIRLFIISVRRE